MRADRGRRGRRWSSCSGATANVPPDAEPEASSQSLLVAAVAVAGCGRETPATDPERPALVAPQRAEPENLGFPEQRDEEHDAHPRRRTRRRLAAAVARAVYPGADAAARTP